MNRYMYAYVCLRIYIQREIEREPECVSVCDRGRVILGCSLVQDNAKLKCWGNHRNPFDLS